MSFTLHSPAFAQGEEIPADYTADGKDIAPRLQWSQPPVGTQSLALIVDDPDAPDPKAPQSPQAKPPLPPHAAPPAPRPSGERPPAIAGPPTPPSAPAKAPKDPNACPSCGRKAPGRPGARYCMVCDQVY